MEGVNLRRLAWAVAGFAGVLVVGTVGFVLMLNEGWTSSFYRAVVTTTLTGLDTKPEGWDAELFSVGLLISGVAIFSTSRVRSRKRSLVAFSAIRSASDGGDERSSGSVAT